MCVCVCVFMPCIMVAYKYNQSAQYEDQFILWHRQDKTQSLYATLSFMR